MGLTPRCCVWHAYQVEMVEWFARSLEAGVSRVQQMIMGAGKTTVVGPLLTLLLADGKHLVTQVLTWRRSTHPEALNCVKVEEGMDS